MNKTKIEWTDYTWNPVTGCLHNCWYCYAKKLFIRFHRSFEPTFYPERLEEPSKLKKPSKIFCCSVADLFANWTKKEWRDAVLNEISKYPHHIFQLLTKEPQNIDKNYDFGKNVWVGVTITNKEDTKKIEFLRDIKCGVRFVSFEPLLDDVIDGANLYNVDWIIVGKLTGSKKVKLKKEWVEGIIRYGCLAGIPIFIKNNIGWKEKIQEFPNDKLSWL